MTNIINAFRSLGVQFSSPIQRMMTASRYVNPVLLTAGDEEGAATNTVATLTAIGADSTTDYDLFTTDDYPDNGELFTVYGGIKIPRDPDYPDQGWQVKATTYDTVHHYPRVNGWRVSFLTDAPAFDIWGPLSTVTGIRVLVDGRFVSRTVTMSSRTSGGIYDWFHVVLPASGLPRRYRRIDIEQSDAQSAFRGIALPSGYLPMPIQATERYRIAVYGDSFGEGTGTTIAEGGSSAGFGNVAGYLLGGVDLDIVQMALGGTGFINTNGSVGNFLDHIDDLDAQPIDEVWIEGGINDAYPSNTVAAITAAALAFFQAVRAKLPNAPIVVLGIARTDAANAATTEDAVKAAFDYWADMNSMFIPFQTTGAKLFNGSNSDDSVASNFSANAYGGGRDGTDNTHPNGKGHQYMAEYIATRRRAM